MRGGWLIWAISGLLCLCVFAGCPPSGPTLALSETAHQFAHGEHFWAVTISNAASGTTLSFTAEASPAWLTVTPASGISKGPSDAVVLKVSVIWENVGADAANGWVNILSNGGNATLTVGVDGTEGEPAAEGSAEGEGEGETVSEGELSEGETPPVAVTIPDANLDARLHDLLTIAQGLPLYASDLATLQEADLHSAEIVDLEGIEYCTTLTVLDLSGNQLSSIEALATMSQLTWLNLAGNELLDLAALGNLTDLSFLNVADNTVASLAPLSGLVGLRTLWAANCGLDDIAPLAALSSLQEIHLDQNAITDLTPLESLIDLNLIYLSENQIADLTALLNNSGIETGDVVDLRGNAGLTGATVCDALSTLSGRGVTVWSDSECPAVRGPAAP